MPAPVPDLDADNLIDAVAARLAEPGGSAAVVNEFVARLKAADPARLRRRLFEVMAASLVNIAHKARLLAVIEDVLARRPSEKQR